MSTGSDYAVVAAIGALLVQLNVGWKQSRAALLSAEAASRSAQAALATAENTLTLREQELSRAAVVAACQVQTERLERLRSDMAELFSICYMQPISPQIEGSRRQRALLLTARLRLMIFPQTPIGEVLNADLDKVQVKLIEQTSTGTNEALWVRISLNAMRLILTEEIRIEEQLISGEYMERRLLRPKMQPGDTPWLDEEQAPS